MHSFWTPCFTGQEATVRTAHGTTDWFQIGKGLLAEGTQHLRWMNVFISKALTLHILKKVGLYMRSYPLLGLFLVTRHAVSKTASSTAILRPTATGISLLFLSLMHSSAAIEVRVTDVTGWPQRWKVILPPPALASQRRKRDGGTGLVPAASEAQKQYAPFIKIIFQRIFWNQKKKCLLLLCHPKYLQTFLRFNTQF